MNPKLEQLKKDMLVESEKVTTDKTELSEQCSTEAPKENSNKTKANTDEGADKAPKDGLATEAGSAGVPNPDEGATSNKAPKENNLPAEGGKNSDEGPGSAPPPKSNEHVPGVSSVEEFKKNLESRIFNSGVK